MRKEKRGHNDIEFIGVDGEGVDRPDGSHEYVMLSVGDRTLWDNGRSLSLRSILEFLYESYLQKPDAAFVGFFLGYDFIQWLKLLPEDRARLLFTNAGILERKSSVQSRANPYPDAVVWEGWEIDIMAGRRFKLRPHICHSSRWQDVCRNRTCRKSMGDPTTLRLDSEPAVILKGEMEFAIPDDDGEAYDDDVELFWRYHTRLLHTVGEGNNKTKAAGWMYICDTGPFWQTSFLNVINPKAWDGNAVCTQEEYDLVLAGKADRGHLYEHGDTNYFAEMARYNTLENDILARVTQRLNQGFMNDRIPIKIPKTDWYGPGRAAQLWMDQLHELMCDREAKKANVGKLAHERANEYGLLNRDVYASMPTWFYEAAQASYYGGWFEQFMHGHIGDVWEYDINSAYPFIIASLPCLHTEGIHNGTYSRGSGSGYTETGYVLLFGTFTGSNPYIGALPYRDRHGLISRPQQTKGWYWKHEVEAAMRAKCLDTMEIEKWVSYTPCTCTPPFDPATIGIRSLYQLRLDFGKNTPQGKSAKLVYNSAYGKTAQSIGTPKYSNPVYASLITAGCRTLILESIASHPRGTSSVSMVATDGIYFTERHPFLEINATRLGAWDETFKPNLTQLMPGVYWDEKTREAVREGANAKLKSRGVSGRDLAKEIERLDMMFLEQERRLANGEGYDWPEIRFSTGFLLDSCKAALARGKWNTAGKVTHGAVRTISANPHTKREPVAYWDADEEVVRTRPYTMMESLESTPYQKSFGYVEYQEGMSNVFGDRVGRDGDDGMQFWKDLLNG